MEKHEAKAMAHCDTVSYKQRSGSGDGTYEKAKKRAAGTMIIIAVATFTGRSRVFCRRPPQQKAVLPEKYW
jgi:uncharacterized protein (AIM24 family)